MIYCIVLSGCLGSMHILCIQLLNNLNLNKPLQILSLFFFTITQKEGMGSNNRNGKNSDFLIILMLSKKSTKNKTYKTPHTQFESRSFISFFLFTFP